tara:strand:+ start:1552 stop:1941 length:390 start_codon:yes stop_codon:yes gene_type:complete
MSNRKIINTVNAPQAIGPYSQAIKINNLLFTSGQIPLLPDSGEIISNNFSEQVEQCLKNIEAILVEESLNLDSIVKLTVFLVDLSDFDLLNEQFVKYFGYRYPSRSVVEVSRLPKDVKVEIEAICCYDK